MIGEEHEKYTKFLGNSAILDIISGNLDEGKNKLEICIVVYEKKYGKNHIHSLPILVNLANVYERIGDLNKTKEL